MATGQQFRLEHTYIWPVCKGRNRESIFLSRSGPSCRVFDLPAIQKKRKKTKILNVFFSFFKQCGDDRACAMARKQLEF